MRQWMPIAALLAITSLCGCAGLGDRISDFLRAGSWWQAAQTNDIRLRAETLEEQGETRHGAGSLAADRTHHH